MPELRFLAQAPSNIALVKYMGKRVSGLGPDALSKEGAPGLNLPENASLSMTLDSLCTWVELSRTEEPGSGEAFRFVPELPRGLPARDRRGQPLEGRARVPALEEAGVVRARRHFERASSLVRPVLARHGVCLREGAIAASNSARGPVWTLRTANTFPPGSGIASSASSFAAITLATAMAECADANSFNRAWETAPLFRQELAAISRQGSGSSCRSFQGPWVLWEGERATTVESRLPRLAHFVLLVSESAKTISSSEAHQRVKSSPLWEGRVARADARAARLREILAQGDLGAAARLAWGEAWEMHSLFHTAAEPFTYWEPATVALLKALAPLVSRARPPIVTLDAGPNVHLTVEFSQVGFWRDWLRERFSSLTFLEDEPGEGARPFFQA